MIVEELFPTPLLRVNIKDELDISEIEKLKLLSLDKKNLIPNGNNGNFFHKNVDLLKTYIPNSTTEKVIKKYLDIFLHDILLEKEANVRITGSWINVNPPRSVHHEHFHMNSILSGTLYLNAEANKGGEFIVHKTKANTRQVASHIYGSNKFVDKWKYIPVNTYDLHIFPSILEHSVASNRSKTNRLSLSFNTFYIGEVLMNPKNAVTSLTRLDIKELG
jgi:uncharacterized protein (TIGR02466 family)